MTRAAARTGVGPTLMAAVEQHFPARERILVDDLAGAILPPGARAFVRAMRPAFARNWMVRTTERGFPGLWSGIMCRKRYIDEALVAASDAIEAIVDLGAGFDTRAYRLPRRAGVPAWEVDQPANIEAKRNALKRRFGGVPANATLVPIDFERDALEPTLGSHGYQRGRPTFFVWEAVTQYLTDGAVGATLDFLARAAQGSRLAFTYVRSDFIDGRNLYGQDRLYERYVAKGVWRFGLAPERVADFLAPYGWQAIEHVGNEELAQRYVQPTGRKLATLAVERVVHAEKR